MYFIVMKYDIMKTIVNIHFSRELIVHNPVEVKDFIGSHDNVLATRIKREARDRVEKSIGHSTIYY